MKRVLYNLNTSSFESSDLSLFQGARNENAFLPVNDEQRRNQQKRSFPKGLNAFWLQLRHSSFTDHFEYALSSFLVSLKNQFSQMVNYLGYRALISDFFKFHSFRVSVYLSCAIFFSCVGVSSSVEISDDEILTDILWAKIINLSPPDRPAVGLALSGGGARGFAHVGVLDILNNSGFPIDYIAGTSMGAVIGALYSSGMDMDGIWNFGKETASIKISKDFSGLKAINLIFRDKLITPKYITEFIEKSLGAYTFENLKYPFACVAMDFKTGEKIIFNSGPVGIAVRSSGNLPGIFTPIKYRHRYLVDGGVVDFLPVDVAKLLGAQWVLASVTESNPEVLPKNVLNSLMQVIDIRGNLLSAQAQDEADFVLKPSVGDIKTADFNKCIEAGEMGIIETNRKLKKLKRTYLTDVIHLIMRKF